MSHTVSGAYLNKYMGMINNNLVLHPPFHLVVRREDCQIVFLFTFLWQKSIFLCVMWGDSLII